MDIRLIALDLDGTALSQDRKHFSPRLTAALREAHQGGIAVLPVTGRQFELLPPALQEEDHPWKNLAVLCNGGELRRFSDGAVLVSRPIPQAALQGLLELSQELDIPVEFSHQGTLHYTRKSWEQEQEAREVLRFHLEEILTRFGTEEESLEELCRRPGWNFEKAMLPWIPEDRKQVAAAALNRLDIAWSWSSPNGVEIAGPGATKANGLRDACALLHIELSQVLAIGDSGNDITMLKCAGLGIAMGNAPWEVKAAADAETASNREDGAALAVEHWALGQRNGL